MAHKKMTSPSTGVENRAYGEDWNKLIDHLEGTSATDPLTFNVNQHNLKDSTANAAGDLLKGNATKFVRFPRGTASQQLRTNAAGTDVEWFTPAAGAWDPNLAETMTNKTLTAPIMSSFVELNELADPVSPAANKGRVFFDDTDEHLKIKKSSGTVVDLENGTYGATSVADGGTITHNLGTTPIVVTCTPSIASEMVSVTTVDATTFTVAIKKHDNSAGTTQTVYWRATV